MSLRRFATLATVLLLAPASLHAASSWPSNLNAVYISGSMGTSYSRQDAVIGDDAGGVFIGWPETNTIRVQHKLVSGGNASGWAAAGVIACNSSFGGSRSYVALARDGGQGVYVAWVDNRPGDIADIYLHHVLADGTLDPLFPAGGMRVTTTASMYDYYPAAVADGAGGVYLTWIADDQNPGPDLQRITRVTASGTFAAGWSSAGLALHTTGTPQFPAALASDGANGAVVVFSTSNTQLRVQRALANGTLDAAHWPADGSIVTSTALNGTYFHPRLFSRNPAETFLCWTDTRAGNNDAYVLRVTPDGIAAGWPATGLAASALAGPQRSTVAVPDGTGGALLSWIDTSAGTARVYAHRVLANAVLDPAWPAGGKLLMTYDLIGLEPLAAAATSDGMIVMCYAFEFDTNVYQLQATRVRTDASIPLDWVGAPKAMIQETGTGHALYAVSDLQDGAVGILTHTLFGGQIYDIGQRIRWNGARGAITRPLLTAVSDVGPDQGGTVRLFWESGDNDVLPNNPVASYDVWRQITTLQAQAKLADAPIASATSPRIGSLRQAETASGATLYWEYIGNWPSRGVSAYSQLVSTVSDSMAGSTGWETFVVDAVAPDGTILGTSPPDSGYSIDNLAPPAPAPFTAAYASGATHLHWGTSPAADFSHFVLYRGASAGFVPGPATLIATPPDTGHADPGPAGSYYKLAAVDVHGNVGAYALVTPSATTGVSDGSALLAFTRISPNPARGEAAWSISLPQAGTVELALYDVSGRRARTIVNGARAAGTFVERWDGNDAEGRGLPNGVYVVRLVFAGRSLTQRLTLIR